MNNIIDSYIDTIGNFKPSEKEKKIIYNVINKLNNNIKVCRDIVFICTHNSRRSIFCEVWANILANKYLKNINFYSAGTERTSIHNEVIKSFSRLGIKTKENTIQIGETSIILKSKILKELKLDSFISIFTCGEAEESCPIDRRSQINIPLLFDDPKRYDGLKNERIEYDKTCSLIAKKLNFIIKRIN